MTRKPLADRFWQKVSKTESCWLWTGSTDHWGYGWIQAHRDGKWRATKAHRVSLEIHGLEVQTGAIVMHICDNPPCVNPAHLRVATQRENIRDASAKGRMKAPCLRGEDSGNAKFTNRQAGEIRQRLLSGERGRDLAREFSVSESTISYIKKGYTYPDAGEGQVRDQGSS